MSLGVARVQRFGGLNLTADPGEVGLEACVDCSNIELAIDLSYVKQRDGLSELATTLGTSGSSAKRAVRGGGSSSTGRAIVTSTTSTTVYVDEVVTATGAITALGNFAASSVGFVDAINYGTPTTSVTFIATDGIGTLRKVSSSTLASSVGKPKYLGVLSDSNRLIQGYFAAAADSPTGANGSKSTVFFSDAGAPETFSANNYVHLRPGDGESIQGIVTWRGQTFVFKETVFFVFGPESTDEDGNPVFDYRAVSLKGQITTSQQSVVAGDDGVYYLTSIGVFRTTGGPPVEVSLSVRSGVSTYAGQISALSKGRIFVHSASAGLLLYEGNGQWVIWDLSPQYGSTNCPLTAIVGTTYHLPGRNFLALSSATSDGGGGFASYYQSGYSDLGSPTPKVVRRAEVWGTGGDNWLTFAMGVDYGTPGSGTALTLPGVSSAAGNAFESTARRGTNHCFKLSVSSLAWRCNAVNLYFTKPSPVGTAR